MSATSIVRDYLSAVGHVGSTVLTGPAERRGGRLATLAILTGVVPAVSAAAALLEQNPRPTDADIDADSDAAMSGNICRCGTYLRIRAGIRDAAQKLPPPPPPPEPEASPEDAPAEAGDAPAGGAQ